MSDDDPRDEALEEDADVRLRGTVTADAVSVDLVSAIAGDRSLTDDEVDRVGELKAERGGVFFSDLLYAISHHYFAPEIAERLWDDILQHKLTMSRALDRNVRITVATLDYLSNITHEIASLTLMAETSVAEMVNVSMRDGMTGLFNHSTCYELLELELRNHQRHDVGVGLILLDIDDFKAVNDSLGHQEGDRILFDLAKVLEGVTRDADICCRFGGEEFAVILPFTNETHEALVIAERIRRGVTKIKAKGQTITISAGVALCEGPMQTARALVEHADRALYQAKARGKNQVVANGAPG